MRGLVFALFSDCIIDFVGKSTLSIASPWVKQHPRGGTRDQGTRSNYLVLSYDYLQHIFVRWRNRNCFTQGFVIDVQSKFGSFTIRFVHITERVSLFLKVQSWRV